MVARLVRSIPADGHIYRYLLFLGGGGGSICVVCVSVEMQTLHTFFSLPLSLSPETCPFRKAALLLVFQLPLVKDERSIHHWGGGGRGPVCPPQSSTTLDASHSRCSRSISRLLIGLVPPRPAARTCPVPYCPVPCNSALRERRQPTALDPPTWSLSC